MDITMSSCVLVSNQKKRTVRRKHFCDLAQEMMVLLSQFNIMFGKKEYAAAINPPLYLS
jgi:hypothetical protein